MSLPTKNNTFLCHRVKMVSPVNVVHRVLQGLLEQGVGQVLLAQKVPRYSQTCLFPATMCIIWVLFYFFFFNLSLIIFLLLFRVLLDLLDPLEAQGCLAYRECREKEELLEVLDQKGIRWHTPTHTARFILTPFLLPIRHWICSRFRFWPDLRGNDCVAVLLI